MTDSLHNAEQKLILIRGVPGTGKTTLATTKYKEMVHLEADMYFIKDGVYKYDQSKIKLAHEWCRKEAGKSMRKGDNVVVSHTFIFINTLYPYIKLAELYKAKVEIIELTKEYGSIHAVPEDKMKWFRDTYKSAKPLFPKLVKG